MGLRRRLLQVSWELASAGSPTREIAVPQNQVNKKEIAAHATIVSSTLIVVPRAACEKSYRRTGDISIREGVRYGDITRRRLNRARVSIGGGLLDDRSQVFDSAVKAGTRTLDPPLTRGPLTLASSTCSRDQGLRPASGAAGRDWVDDRP